MIDAEKLLGKLLSSAVKGGGRKRKKQKYKKSDDLMGSLVGNLATGKGLMTAIGLGVGAYTIFKSKSGGELYGGSSSSSQPPPPPQQRATSVPTPPPVPTPDQGPSSQPSQDLAVRLIQTMVAAAHADGRLDEEEELRILERLQEQGLAPEEKRFLLDQLHHPLTISQLIEGVDNPQVGQTMYSLAVSTIVIDTREERSWLDTLGDGLSISSPMRSFIEQEL